MKKGNMRFKKMNMDELMNMIFIMDELEIMDELKLLMRLRTLPCNTFSETIPP